MLLPIPGKIAVWLDLHTIFRTAFYKCCPNGSPAIFFTSGQQDFEKQCPADQVKQASELHGNRP
jgi:hypothetical protein